MKIRLKNTKLVSEKGAPLMLYHGTPCPTRIKSFMPLTHFGNLRAARMRSMHFICKALNIPEPMVLPDHPPKNWLEAFRELKDAPNYLIYSVHLCIKSPLRLPDIADHGLSQYYRWFMSKYKPKAQFLTFPERMEGDVVGPEKIKYKKTLSEFIFLDPFTRSQADLEKELAAESLYHLPLTPRPKEALPAFLAPVFQQAKTLPFELPEHVAYQRLIRFLEGEKYDGFVYCNEYEDKGNDSYIIFRPQQVFNPKYPSVEHEIPVQSPENQAFLKNIEAQFFASRQCASPSKRLLLHSNSLRKSHER